MVERHQVHAQTTRDRLRDGDQTILDRLAETNHDVYLGWLLLDQLRAVYLARDHQEAMRLLDEWIYAACVSELEPFVRTATHLRHPPPTDRQRHRPWPHQRPPRRDELDRPTAQPPRPRLPPPRILLAMITLVCGRIPVQPPREYPKSRKQLGPASLRAPTKLRSGHFLPTCAGCGPINLVHVLYTVGVRL